MTLKNPKTQTLLCAFSLMALVFILSQDFDAKTHAVCQFSVSNTGKCTSISQLYVVIRTLHIYGSLQTY